MHRGAARRWGLAAVALTLGCADPTPDGLAPPGRDAGGTDTTLVADGLDGLDPIDAGADATEATDTLPDLDAADAPRAPDTPPRLPATGWRWDNPRPQGLDILGMWGSGPTDVWAVGQRGLLLHFDGAEWTPVPSGVDVDLLSIWGTARDDVYVAMGTSELLHFDGARWAPIPAGGSGAIRTVSGASGDLVVGGEPSLVRRRRDGAWTDVPGLAGSAGWLWSPGSPMLFTSGWPHAGLQRYDGTTWSHVVVSTESEGDGLPLWYPIGVWGSGVSNLFALSIGYVPFYNYLTGVHRFDGETWTKVAQYDGRPAAILGSGPDDVYAIGATAAHWDGDRWTQLPLQDEAVQLRAGWMVAPGELLAGGTSGILYRFSGHRVTRLHVGWPHDVLIAHAAGPEEVYAIGSFQHHPLVAPTTALLRGDASGWSVLPSPGIDEPSCLWAAGRGEVHVLAGALGRHHVYRGGSWSEVGQLGGACSGIWGLGATLYAVSGSCGGEIGGACVRQLDGQRWSVVGEVPGELSRARVVWAGAPDQIFISNGSWAARWDGAAWTPAGLPPSEHPVHTSPWAADLWGSGPDDVYLARYTDLLHFDGVAWRRVEAGLSGDPRLTGVWGESRDSVYVTGAAGQGLLHWNGVSWQPVDLGSGGGGPLHGVWGSGAGDLRVFGPAGLVLRGQTP
jgi:hypothetical protein